MRRLTTDDEGMAKNVFWITDRRGNKLSNFHARMLQERVGDFVVYCTPDSKVPLDHTACGCMLPCCEVHHVKDLM